MQQGVKTDAACNIQKCWELLAKHVASVCAGRNRTTFAGIDVNSDTYLKQVVPFWSWLPLAHDQSDESWRLRGDGEGKAGIVA